MMESKFSIHGLHLEIIGPEKADIIQNIYFNSPTYFRSVDGTEPLEGMALKDIEDMPSKRGDHYIKVAALIYEGSNQKSQISNSILKAVPKWYATIGPINNNQSQRHSF